MLLPSPLPLWQQTKMQTSIVSPTDHRVFLFTVTACWDRTWLLQQGEALVWLRLLQVFHFRKQKGVEVDSYSPGSI